MRLEKGWDERVASTPSNTPAFQQPYLAAASLLRRGSDDHHAPRQVLSVGLQSQGGAHGGHGDKIVAAAVADFRQRIVFRQHGNRRPFPAASGYRGPERRLDAADAPFHR